MKLVRIDHMRCGETAASTYLWAPEGLTEEQFEADVETAKVTYSADAQAAAAFAGPRPAGSYAPLGSASIADADPDTLTVGEIRARAEQARSEWQAWEERRRAASKPFGAYLLAKGYLAFYDHEPDLASAISWGHQHGVSIDYGAVDPARDDLRGALRRRPTSKRTGRVTLVGHEEYVATDPTDPIPASDDPWEG
jgi:hypothetical protein